MFALASADPSHPQSFDTISGSSGGADSLVQIIRSEQIELLSHVALGPRMADEQPALTQHRLIGTGFEPFLGSDSCPSLNSSWVRYLSLLIEMGIGK